MAERSWTVEVEDFDRDVFAHDPRHPRALLGLARLLAESGADDEALRLLERVSPSVPLAATAERLAAELRTRGGVDGDEPHSGHGWRRTRLISTRGRRSGAAEPPLDFHDPERVARAKVWQRKLFEAGYVAMGWPREYGGRGADVMRQTIVNEEMVRARAPGLIGLMGIQMVGPTLIAHGTEEQRRRHLPPILTAEEIWCQGYSEPGSGSDLASLRTRAELRGDEFVVNGQKVWTSNAQYADWMFCLVRTDPDAPKHAGISYVLIDMKSPGISVRPLVQMTGDPGFNEVFFEDVRVPRANLVGQLNAGWQVANATLAHES